MSARYLAKQIAKGALPYEVIVEPSKWAKFKDEVDALLIEMGCEHLVQKEEVQEPTVDGGVEEVTPEEDVTTSTPEAEEEV